MSLSESIEKQLNYVFKKGKALERLRLGDHYGFSKEVVVQHAKKKILAAIKEEGYICVGKETVKKIMGEEE